MAAVALIAMCVAVECEDSAGREPTGEGEVQYARQIVLSVRGLILQCITNVASPNPRGAAPPRDLPTFTAPAGQGGGDDLLVFPMRVRAGFSASELEELLKAYGRRVEDLASDNLVVDPRTLWEGDWMIVDLRRHPATLPEQPVLEQAAEVILEATRSSLGSVERNDGAMVVMCGLAPKICAAAFLFAEEYRSHATASGKCTASVETRWLPAARDGAGNVDLFGRALFSCRDWTGAIAYCESRAMEFVFPSEGTTVPPTDLKIWAGRTWLADCEAAGMTVR